MFILVLVLNAIGLRAVRHAGEVAFHGKERVVCSFQLLPVDPVDDLGVKSTVFLRIPAARKA